MPMFKNIDILNTGKVIAMNETYVFKKNAKIFFRCLTYFGNFCFGDFIRYRVIA